MGIEGRISGDVVVLVTELCTAFKTHHFAVLTVRITRRHKRFQSVCDGARTTADQKVALACRFQTRVCKSRRPLFTFRIVPSEASTARSRSQATAWNWPTRGQAPKLSGSNLTRAGGVDEGEASARQARNAAHS